MSISFKLAPLLTNRSQLPAAMGKEACIGLVSQFDDAAPVAYACVENGMGDRLLEQF
jgi:hypothetical protein